MSSPNQLAKEKFFRHIPAVLGLGYVILCLFVALFGYVLSPDNSTHANLQVLELAKQPPGAEAWLLIQPSGIPDSGPVSWLRGNSHPGIPFALQDTQSVQLTQAFVSFTRLSGVKDSLRLSDFGLVEAPARTTFMDGFVEKRHYWLGTDPYGRDLLSRILLGTRVSLSVGLLAVLISLVVGVLLGTLAGYFGGWVDQSIMWLVSVMWSIPTLLMALAITFWLGKGFWQLFVAIGISMWVEVARLVRGQMMSVREMTFSEAARSMGFSHPRIMFRHILPNVINPIIVVAVANFGAAVLIESGLSFLGIGVEVPIPSWGRMIYEGYTYIVFEHGKWLAFFPGIALILLIVSINLIGIGLRDAWDVKMK
ncbi:ABC transporter permease [Pontibacter sp. G13]|uniref:ABC transporter permease n=1 Tax=Pontibacter sp. G13 TaxID=3074898 RepID=UPI00288BA217|nr:ABC transporter permease [Pontibacter sp. G13]WNJ20149.1 ABC transporter permease [Pontibacter sp. G13]